MGYKDNCQRKAKKMSMIGAQVPDDLAERVRNIAYWQKITVSRLIEDALGYWVALPDMIEIGGKQREKIRKGRGAAKKNAELVSGPEE